MEAILTGLNEHQKCAVTSAAPVLQVLAPPGSGKTKTLTSRVAYLISQQGLQPWNIIVCTFTLKAAREMKQRIQTFIGAERESKLILGTFHSICRRYLSRYGHYLGIPKTFGIADSSDSLAILKRLIKRHRFEIEPSKARSRISRRKSKLVVNLTRAGPKSVEAQEFEQLFELYENCLKISNLLDYDDLLLRCLELLKQFPECCSNIQAILVDEFQDTNTVQYELINLLAQHGRSFGERVPPSITIVGDPDQSIYSFRSAEVKNLLNMQQKYTDTQVVMLQQNYRSAGAIIECATQVIEQDESRPKKRMRSTHGYGTMPVLRELENPKQEAFWTVREIKRLTQVTGRLLQYADFAILLRSASLSRLIESELGIAGIPYRMVGGHRFFDRKEVKLILDYMRVIAQPEHSEALLRIINEPSRKIGDVTIKNLIEHADSNGWTLWQLIRKMVQKGYNLPEKISKQASDGLTGFFNIITRGQTKLSSLKLHSDNLALLLDFVCQAIGLDAYLKKESQDKETLENRLENVNELRIQAEAVMIQEEAAVIGNESEGELYDDLESDALIAGHAALSTFLTNVALATDAQAVEGQTAQAVVTISTIHAAKGLEWPVVFIPALYQGSIPHSRAEDNDEERRLLYVGMTRAQALLYLSWPTQKTKDEYHCLSSFITGEAIRKKFRKLGPSLDAHQGVIGLSDILARPCPSRADIQEARSQCEKPYDAAFVDERSYQERTQRDLGAVQPTDAASRSYRSWTNPASHMSDTTIARSTIYTQTFNRAPQNQALNTGVQCNGGFASARTLERDLGPSMKRNTSNEYKEQASAKKSNVTTAKRQKKLAGQGTLTSFFQQPSESHASLSSVAPSDFYTPSVKSRVTALANAQHYNVASNPLPPKEEEHLMYHRQIRSTKSTPQPVILHEEDDMAARRRTPKYVLLSSSPPPVLEADPKTKLTRIDDAMAKENKTAATASPIKPSTDHAITKPSAPALAMKKMGYVKRLGTGARAMKSWSEIQREKQASRLI